MEQNIVLTPSALLTFLNEIEELEGKQIGFVESDDNLSITIGESTYVLNPIADEAVQLDAETFDVIEEANEEGYAELNDEFEEADPDAEIVEGGIIKELVKTLALGGLVRLTKDALLKA